MVEHTESMSSLPDRGERREIRFRWPSDIQPKEAEYMEELFKIQIGTIKRIAQNNVRKTNALAEFDSWMTANKPATTA